MVRRVLTGIALTLCTAVIIASCAQNTKPEVTEKTTVTEVTETTETTKASETTEEPSSETSAPDPDARTVEDFTVYDREGNPKKLSDLRGKPVVLNFWATWCHYCVEEIPQFEEAYKKYGDQVEFMMVDLTDGYQEKQEWGEEFIDNKKLTMPFYFDLDMDAAAAHSVRSIPVTMLINSDGTLYDYTLGQIGDTYLEDNIPHMR